MSFHEQITSFGWTYWTRNALLGTGLGAALFIAAAAPAGGPALPAWAILSLAVVTACVIGRALFYVLVIPTTMPGAFFWRNKGFEEHARATGLAARAQVGVAPLH